jgi:hypothetical protein
MSAQISVDVRALFSELGIPSAGAEVAEVLVIDRFEQWHNSADASVRGTVGTFSCLAETDEWVEAA